MVLPTEEDWEEILATGLVVGVTLVVLLGPFLFSFLCWYSEHTNRSKS